MDTVVTIADRALYEADEHLWIARQIEALRSGRLDDLDRDTLAEYLADQTKRDHRELGSRFTVLLQHLLKLMMWPRRFGRRCALTVIVEQQEISSIFDATPSISTYAPHLFAEAYADAKQLVAAETGVPCGELPPESPWTMEAALAFEPPPAPRRRASR